MYLIFAMIGGIVGALLSIGMRMELQERSEEHTSELQSH